MRNKSHTTSLFEILTEKSRFKEHIESVHEEKKKKMILTALSMPNIIIVTKNKQDQTCEPGSVAIASG